MGTSPLDKINQGEESARRVNQLFLNAGFNFVDANAKLKEKSIDIGELDGIWFFEKFLILIESTKQDEKITEKMSKFFNKWADKEFLEKLKSKYDKFNVEIIRVFVNLNKERKEEKSSIDFLKREKNNIIFYLDDIIYFEQQYKSVGKYCISEILYSLRIPLKPLRLEIKALKCFAGRQELFVFTFPVKELLKICYVSRRKNRFGYQRLLSYNRLSKIAQAVQKAETITFPNSIIVTPDKPFKIINEEKGNIVEIILPINYCSLRIIDGQHRLYGFTGLPDSEIDKYDLVVVALNVIEKNKEVLTFITINNEFKRVDQNLILNLKADLEEIPETHEFFEDIVAVKVARKLDEDSELSDKIYFGEIEEQIIGNKSSVTLTTLVTSLRKNKLISKNSLLEIDLDDVDSFYEKIKAYLSCSVSKNMLIKEIIWDNRGIRLFFRLIQLALKNIDKKNITKGVEEFLEDFASILTDDFIKVLFEYYGEGGAINATFKAISALKEQYEEYRYFLTDLRYLK